MQDDTELSTKSDTIIVEKPLGNPLKPTHALCVKCKQVKPIKQFKMMSTNAQAKAWGYNKAIQITTNNCKDCRPERKPQSELTLKELTNRVMNGDIEGGYANGKLLLENKRHEILQKKRQSVANRWKKVRASEWDTLMKASTKEFKRVSKAREMLAKSSKKPLVELLPNDPSLLLSNFFTTYHLAIKSVRSLFKLEKGLGIVSPTKNYAWYDYIPKQVREQLQQTWDTIPVAHKQHKQQPEVFKSLTTKE